MAETVVYTPENQGGIFGNDKDGYDGIAFTRFFADCSGKGVPIV